MALLPWTFEPSAIPALCDFSDLPSYPALEELKARRQWVAWRYEERNGRMTKPPVSPHSGFGASHSKPSTWGTYRQACDYAERKTLPGIGFVLSHDDNLTGADLDKVRDPVTGRLEPWAQAIVDLAETYVEISPSGTGLRLIWRGKIEKTLKSDPCRVEVYASQRYLTITGWHLDGTPDDILPAPKTWAALQERVAVWKAENDIAHSGGEIVLGSPVSERDQSVRVAVSTLSTPSDGGSPFYRNVNSAALAGLAAWVPDLFGSSAVPQPGTGAYRVSSKALGRNLEEDLSIAPSGCVDWGVHDMGDGRRGKRTPVDLAMEYGGAPDARAAAFWLCERLGKAPEGLGWSPDNAEAGASIAAGLLQARAVVEAPDGTLADAVTGEVIETRPPSLPDDPIGNDFVFGDTARPDGLLGQITDWIVATSRKPNRPLAMTAAIAIMAGICSRHLMGPTGSATHLYLVNLGATSIGKDRPFKAIGQLLKAAGYGSILQSAKFKSDTAIELVMKTSRTAVATVDEIGSAIFAKMGNRRATTHESAISSVLRELWSVLPGDDWQTSSRAGERSETLASPALTIMGVSTLNEFYRSLTGASVDNGFLNRFTIIMADPPSEERDEEMDRLVVPKSLGRSLAAILPNAGNLDALNALLGYEHPAAIVRIPWETPEVEQMHLSLARRIARWRDSDDTASPFLGRTAEMAVRLATIHAVGCAGRAAAVTERDYRWGASVALASARFMIEDAALRMAETDFQANQRLVLGFVKKAERMKRAEITRKIDGRWEPSITDRILRSLAEGGQIVIIKGESTKEGGRKPDIYVYVQEKRS